MGRVLFTIGYEGRTAAELVAALTGAGIDAVADVRLTPRSRKPGLSKHRLTDALTSAGIGYLHLPALGNPVDNRAGFRRADAASWAVFRGLLSTAPALGALEQLQLRTQREQVALLCFEREAQQCHRRLVGDYLRAADPRLVVYDLTIQPSPVRPLSTLRNPERR